MITAYKATAEIVSAYDDGKVATESGIVEISRCGVCGHTTVTAAFCGYLAQEEDTTESLSEIHMLATEAAHRAIIETGEYIGCQIGFLYLGEEIKDAYRGKALDIFNGGAAA